DAQRRRRCHISVEWWGALMLNKLTNPDDPRGAKLLRIIKSCPARVDVVLRSVLKDFVSRSATLAALELSAPGFPEVEVFVDSTILESTFQHVFENALAKERRISTSKEV